MTLPKPIQHLIAAIGAGIALTAVYGLVMSFMQRPPAVFFVGFEAVVLFTGVMLVGFGLGRFKEGPAITLLCAAGAIGAGSLLGYLGTAKVLAGHSITWLVVVRLLVAAFLALLAALEVVARDTKQTIPRLIKGTMALVPLIGLGALYRAGTLSGIISKLSGSSPSVALIAWVIMGAVAGTLFCAAGHFYIRAFILGVQAWRAPAAGGATFSAAQATSKQPRPPTRGTN